MINIIPRRRTELVDFGELKEGAIFVDDEMGEDYTFMKIAPTRVLDNDKKGSCVLNAIDLKSGTLWHFGENNAVMAGQSVRLEFYY